MLLQSLRALCKAPGGAGSIWKYLEALARATGVSGRFAYGFRTELHFADVRELHSYQLQHQSDLIRFLPIESGEDYRDDPIAHTPQRVASPARPKPVLLQFTSDDSQLTINGRLTRTKCTYGGSGRVYEIRVSHVDLHRRRQSKSRLPSTPLNGIIYFTNAVGSSTSGYAVILLSLPISFVY